MTVMWARGRCLSRPLACVPLLLGLWACAPQPAQLTLRFVMAPDQAAGLRDIRLSPAWGGVNRGPVRDADWVKVPAVAASAYLPTANGEPVVAATGPVSAGAFERVFVEVPGIEATAPGGRPVTVVSHIEPIAHRLDLPAGGSVTVDIELVARPLPPWSGPGWAMFVKSATTR
jgi:hypothetical protein